MKYNQIALILIAAKIFGGDTVTTENKLQKTLVQTSQILVRTLPFLSNHKFMQITIDNKPFLAMIDTGAACSLIRKDVLDKIENKKYLSDSEFISLFGNSYITANFQIPNVQIGNFHTEAVFKEEDEKFSADCIVWNHPLIAWKTYLTYQVFREALIGIDLFQNFICVFDFPHASIFLTHEMSEIIEHENFSTAEFHSVPFEIGKAGVVLTCETDYGEKKMLLDSASTISILRPSELEPSLENNDYLRSSILKINNYDHGSWEFRLVELTEKIGDIDGVLGVEFFNKNIICLDFRNKVAHIQTPCLGSKERFNYWLKSCFGN